MEHQLGLGLARMASIESSSPLRSCFVGNCREYIAYQKQNAQRLAKRQVHFTLTLVLGFTLFMVSHFGEKSLLQGYYPDLVFLLMGMIFPSPL
jgi:hypothetical protein